MFNKAMRDLKRLCSPAQLYLWISGLAIAVMLLQNVMYDEDEYCMGMYSCKLNMNKYLVFAGKIVYVLFWTIVLNSLCRTGYEKLSWFLVLLPFIAMFVGIGAMMLSKM
jgi:hypothetical protein